MSESARSKVIDSLKSFRADNWLIMVMYPKEDQGHAMNIRFNSSTKSIEFVNELGAPVKECPLQLVRKKKIFAKKKNFSFF